jgi:hypothetical protein
MKEKFKRYQRGNSDALHPRRKDSTMTKVKGQNILQNITQETTDEPH